MASRYVSPATKEHAQELYDLGLLMMNQDTSEFRVSPKWQQAASFIPLKLHRMYDPTYVPESKDEYIKEDIGYLLED